MNKLERSQNRDHKQVEEQLFYAHGIIKKGKSIYSIQEAREKFGDKVDKVMSVSAYYLINKNDNR